MAENKTPIEFIRTGIFRLNQSDFAAEIGVSQAAVSRWEDGAEPSRKHLARIRDAAHRKGLVWNDALFFETPRGAAR